jgi:hypothetical protein
MLRKQVGCLRWATAMLFTMFATPVFAQKEITFLISADKCEHGPQKRTLTGFLVINPTHDISVGIVTALHGVAGCEVKATSDGSILLRDYLKIAAVDVFSDSALLASDELSRAPAPAGVHSPRAIDWNSMLGSSVTMWGHPAGITIKDTKLSIRKSGKETLYTYLVGMSEEQRKLLKQRKSPDPQLEVVGIDGAIVPGDSGAPLFDSSGHVVAIANGGLFGGFGGLNWAVPIDAITWTSPERSSDYDSVKRQDPGSLFSFEDATAGLRRQVDRGLEPIGNAIRVRYTIKIPLAEQGLNGLEARLRNQMVQLTTATPNFAAADTNVLHISQPGQPDRHVAAFNIKSQLMPMDEYQRNFLSRPPFGVSLYSKAPPPLLGCANIPSKADIEFAWNEAATDERIPDNFDATAKWRGILVSYDTPHDYIIQAAEGVFDIHSNKIHAASALDLSQSYVRVFSRTQRRIEFQDLTIVLGTRSFTLPANQLVSDGCGVIIYRLPIITAGKAATNN